VADSQTATVGLIPWGSNIVNGQLVPQAPSSAFYPTFLGSQARGPGYWPRQGTWQVPPVMPNSTMASQMSPNSGATASASTQAGTANPWHPTKGNIVFSFGALIIGLFMLQYIHYGKGK
jgi:hypothetical protein